MTTGFIITCKHWFASSVWNFCRRVADIPPRETSRGGEERGETDVFAGYKVGRKIKHISVGLLSQSLLNPTENVFTNIERKKRARVDVQRSFCMNSHVT